MQEWEMCPRSTLATISGCQFWTPLKLRRPHHLKVTLLKFMLLILALHRIHTIEGYAFAGSEHISMLVINDIIRCHIFSHWITKITRWSTTTPSRSSTPLPSPGSSMSSFSSSPPVSNICTWWTSKPWDHNNITFIHWTCQDAFNGLESVEHLKLDFLNLNNTVAHTFRGLQAIDLDFRPKHKASRICAL